MTTRRDFLFAAGAGSLAPLLRPFASTAFAQGGPPKRIVFAYSSNGTVQKDFFPDDPSNLTQKPILAPLAPHKNDLIVVKGVGYSGFNTPHSMGTMKALTNIDAFDQRDQTKQPMRGVMYGPSLDTVLSKSVGAKNLRPVLRLGQGWGNNRGWLIFDETGKTLSPIGDPAEAFMYLFGAATGAAPAPGGTTMTDPVAEKRAMAMAQAKKSVLDVIRTDVNSLKARLPSKAQKDKMDQALTSIFELEKGILAGAGTGAGGGPIMAAPVQCKNPSPPAGVAPGTKLGGEERHKAEAELLAMAFGCDVTRVAVWKMMGSADSSAGPFGNFHDTSHKTGDPAADAHLTKVHTYLAGRIGYLIDRLKATKDPLGTGSVFDNTVIYWCNECGHGNHDPNNLPILLAGSAGGFFKTGRFLTIAQQDKGKYGNLLVSLANAVGDTSIKTFGDTRWSTGPMAGLQG